MQTYQTYIVGLSSERFHLNELGTHVKSSTSIDNRKYFRNRKINDDINAKSLISASVAADKKWEYKKNGRREKSELFHQAE